MNVIAMMKRVMRAKPHVGIRFPIRDVVVRIFEGLFSESRLAGWLWRNERRFGEEFWRITSLVPVAIACSSDIAGVARFWVHSVSVLLRVPRNWGRDLSWASLMLMGGGAAVIPFLPLESLSTSDDILVMLWEKLDMIVERSLPFKRAARTRAYTCSRLGLVVIGHERMNNLTVKEIQSSIYILQSVKSKHY